MTLAHVRNVLGLLVAFVLWAGCAWWMFRVALSLPAGYLAVIATVGVAFGPPGRWFVRQTIRVLARVGLMTRALDE